jgi:two-component system, NarL family, nitrate/nitrite response regulator NarL
VQAEIKGEWDMERTQVVVLNFGRLWTEALGRLFEETRFALHPDVKAALGSVYGEEDAPIFLCREREQPGGAIAVVADLRRRHPKAKVVVISRQARSDIFIATMDVGAHGYITDDITGATLVRYLGMVAAGEKVVPAELAQSAMRGGQARLAAPNGAFFSDRETQILRHLAGGASNKCIAFTLNISENTVKGHLKNLLKKIGASNRTQAAVWAMNNGMARSDQEDAQGAV